MGWGRESDSDSSLSSALHRFQRSDQSSVRPGRQDGTACPWNPSKSMGRRRKKKEKNQVVVEASWGWRSGDGPDGKGKVRNYFTVWWSASEGEDLFRTPRSTTGSSVPSPGVPHTELINLSLQSSLHSSATGEWEEMGTGVVGRGVRRRGTFRGLPRWCDPCPGPDGRSSVPRNWVHRSVVQ